MVYTEFVQRTTKFPSASLTLGVLLVIVIKGLILISVFLFFYHKGSEPI